jgi:hypothetical protein
MEDTYTMEVTSIMEDNSTIGVHGGYSRKGMRVGRE